MQAFLVVAHVLSCPKAHTDLSSLTRHLTHVFCFGRWILNPWTTSEVLMLFFLLLLLEATQPILEQ